jgi:hypothetical protein
MVNIEINGVTRSIIKSENGWHEVKDNINNLIYWRLVYLEKRCFRLVLNTEMLKHVEIEFDRKVFEKEFVQNEIQFILKDREIETRSVKVKGNGSVKLLTELGDLIKMCLGTVRPVVKQIDSISFTPIVSIKILSYTSWEIWTCQRQRGGFVIAAQNSDEEVVEINVTDEDILKIFGVQVMSLGYS